MENNSVCGIQFGGGYMDADGGIAPFSTAAKRLSDIGEVMFPDFPQNVYTDIGVILGSGVMSLPVLLKGLEALKAGRVKKLFLTGGAIINDLPETKLFAPLLGKTQLPLPQDGETEADYMAHFLKKIGVPDTAYDKENTSQNTSENFRNIATFSAYRDAESVNIFGILPTRALMTLRLEEDRAETSPKIATLTNVIPLPGIGKGNWVNNDMACNFVLAEFNKIDPTNGSNYLVQGHCKDISLAKEIALANTLMHQATPNAPSDRREYRPKP